jgi:hypothetical protein
MSSPALLGRRGAAATRARGARLARLIPPSPRARSRLCFVSLARPRRRRRRAKCAPPPGDGEIAADVGGRPDRLRLRSTQKSSSVS